MQYLFRFIILITFLLLSLFPEGHAKPRQVIRVAVSDFWPIMFQATDGTIQGFYPDILEHIAEQENWNISYVHGNWSEGLELLKSRQVGLVMYLYRTADRELSMDFTREYMLTVWSQVFVRSENHSVKSIQSLASQKIGLIRESLDGNRFLELADSLSIPVIPVFFSNEADAFQALCDDQVAAVVATSISGNIYKNQYQIQGTPIVFQPEGTYFASARGQATEILKSLDRHLQILKQDYSSIYYQKLSYWLEITPVKEQVVPLWLFILTLGLFLLFVFFLICLIVTSRKSQREKQLIQSRLFQSQKMESLGLLAGSIAHDYHNLLFVIEGNTSLIRHQFINDSFIIQHTEEILMATESAARLTEQFLTFSRKQELTLHPVHVSEFLARNTSLLTRLLPKGVTLQADQPDFGLYCQGDDKLMLQVMMNLVINARDAVGEKGLIRISARFCSIKKMDASLPPEARPGDFIMFSVRDDGCGIPSHILKNIFEPFFTTKDSTKGTGLGLFVVFGIIQQLCGWIDVDSTPGQGTDFRFYLPVAES